MGRLSEEEIKVAAIILWNMWGYRNRVAFRGVTADQGHLCRLIEASLSEQNALESSSSYLGSHRGESLSSHSLWKPPPLSWLKLNVDASWNNFAQIGGVGWIIRDFKGSLISAGFKEIRKLWPISYLEGWAIREGISNYLKLRHLPCSSLIVESDAEAIVNLLNRESFDLSEVQDVVDDVLELSKRVDEIRFSWCPRKDNRIAHLLAREAAMLSLARPQVSSSRSGKTTISGSSLDSCFWFNPSSPSREVCFFGRDMNIPFWLSSAIIEEGLVVGC